MELPLIKQAITMIGTESGYEAWHMSSDLADTHVYYSLVMQYGLGYLQRVEKELSVIGSNRLVEICNSEGGEQWWSSDIDNVMQAIVDEFECPV